MSYRVECAISGRATCNATECKHAGNKIEKDALRFGSWVPFQDRGSWHWKHWGCVTGKQILNLRKYLEGEDNLGSGVYRWDYLDGYDGEEKGSLDGHPDLQEKVRRCITQGFIDPEDWNGDPEMNVLGSEGLRTKESKAKARADKLRTKELEELQRQLAEITTEHDALAQGKGNREKLAGLLAKSDALREQIDGTATTTTNAMNAGKKRGRGQEEDSDAGGDSEEEKKPAKKKRATKAKKDNDDDDAADDVKPAKKSRAKKMAKKEEDDDDEVMKKEEEEVKPAKKSRAKKVVKEEPEEEEAVEMKPVKSSRAKKAAVQKEDIDMIKDEEEPEKPVSDVAPKKRAARRKKAVKEEAIAENGVDASVPQKKNSAKRGIKKAVKQEAVEEDTAMTLAHEANTSADLEQASSDEEKDVLPSLVDQDTVPDAAKVKDEEDEEVDAHPKKKGGQARKAASTSKKSARSSRSRTSSKREQA